MDAMLFYAYNSTEYANHSIDNWLSLMCSNLHTNNTYEDGSNILLSIKHWVAIGGATCGCGVTSAEPAPIKTDAAAGGI